MSAAMNPSLSLILLTFGSVVLAADTKNEAVGSVVSPCPEDATWLVEITRLRTARREQPLAGTLFSKPVVWGSFSLDKNIGRLVDGAMVHFVLSGDVREWKKVQDWPEGKDLYLCYDEVRGATLHDPEGKAFLPLRLVVKADGPSHPINDYFLSLNPVITNEGVVAGKESVRLWRAEIKRCADAVSVNEYLSKVQRELFLEMTEVRLKLCDIRINANQEVIRSSAGGGGSGAGDEVMEYAHEVYRQAYFELAQFAEKLRPTVK